MRNKINKDKLVILVECAIVIAVVLFALWPRKSKPVQPPTGTKIDSHANLITDEPQMSSGMVMAAKDHEAADSPAIAALRAEAHKRGLKWRIYCMEDGFDAWAVGKDDPFAVYIEDGAKPRWARMNSKTQTEAAARLLEAIKGAPEMPVHKPAEHKKICPPEISGN